MGQKIAMRSLKAFPEPYRSLLNCSSGARHEKAIGKRVNRCWMDIKQRNFLKRAKKKKFEQKDLVGVSNLLIQLGE